MYLVYVFLSLYIYKLILNRGNQVIVNFGKNRKPKNIADFHHNPIHAKVLKQKGDELKIKNVVYAMGIGIIDPSNTGMVEFIIEQLN